MSMGRQNRTQQQEMWVEASRLARGPGHPFYRRVNQLLAKHDFDTFVEEQCSVFYAENRGRPSLAPAKYFRLLLIGYFEGIDSERGIAWRVADSISLREFLGLSLSESTPNHSTLSRNRRLIDVETHQEVFTWVLKMLAKSGLLRAKTLGIDSTTLEANAALRSIVRRDSGEVYDEFLERLAKDSGIETPTRADLAKLDRKRKKKGSNDDWKNPHDPDAKITKMKDGRTRLAHKVEHAVDMDSGAVVSVTVHGGCKGDCQSFDETLEEAFETLADVVTDPSGDSLVSDLAISEVVADKGYHSNAVLTGCRERGIRSYISEPARGRRNWKNKPAARDATYANRRRIRGHRGKALLRQRGEKIERSFAHGYETGAMRRLHLRGHGNIQKRLLIHIAGLNLGLVMRQLTGIGKPRGLQGLASALCVVPSALRGLLATSKRLLRRSWRRNLFRRHGGAPQIAPSLRPGNQAVPGYRSLFATAC